MLIFSTDIFHTKWKIAIECGCNQLIKEQIQLCSVDISSSLDLNTLNTLHTI